MYTPTPRALLLIMLSTLLSTFLFGLGGAAQCPVVSTTKGSLEGFKEDKCCHYLGIPYAQPPVGPLRFELPQPTGSWTGVKCASSYGNDCMQDTTLFTGGTTIPMNPSEDCLYLNVRHPKSDSATLRPVLVYFHGGSFRTGGSSAVPSCDLAYKVDIVVVTVNYRLNVFGFSHFDNETGNLGLRDQFLAIQWVKENIENFGGDPNSITLMGHSAGATSCLIHVMNPEAAQTFDRIWTLSNFWSLRTVEQAIAWTDDLMAHFSCADEACLKNVPATDLYEYGKTLSSTAYVDGFVVPFNPLTKLKNGEFAKVPVVQGHQTREGESLLFEVLAGNNLKPENVNEALADLILPSYFDDPEVVKSAYEIYSPAESWFRILSFIAHDAWCECAADEIGEAVAKSGAASWRYYLTHDPEHPLDIGYNFGATHDTILAFIFGDQIFNISFVDKFNNEEKKIRNRLLDSIQSFMYENTPYGATSDFQWNPYTLPASSTELLRTIVDINVPFAGKVQTSYNQRPFCETLWRPRFN